MEEWISQLYKSKGGFGKSTLEKRRSTTVEKRQNIRNSILTQFRHIPENMSPFVRHQEVEVQQNKPVEKKSKRLEMLEKWKKEKEKKKLQAKKNQKPIFKVCRVESNDNLGQVFNHIKGKKIMKRETPLLTVDATLSIENDIKTTKSTSSRSLLKNKSTEQLETQTNFLSDKNIKPWSFNLRSKPDKVPETKPDKSVPYKDILRRNDKFTSSSRDISHVPSTSGTSSKSSKTSNHPKIAEKNLQTTKNKKEVIKEKNVQIKDCTVNLEQNEQINKVTPINKLTKPMEKSASKPSTSSFGISKKKSQIKISAEARCEIDNYSSKMYISSDEEAPVNQSTRQVSVPKSLRKSRRISSSLKSVNLIDTPYNCNRVTAEESKSASSNRKSSRKSFKESILDDSENRAYETDTTIVNNEFILKIENSHTSTDSSELKSLRMSLQKTNLEKTIVSDNMTIKQSEASEEDEAKSCSTNFDGNKNKANDKTPTKADIKDLPQCSVNLTPLFSVNEGFIGSTPFPFYSAEAKSKGAIKKTRTFPKQHCKAIPKGDTLSTSNREISDCNEFILDKSSVKKNRTSLNISEEGNSQTITVTVPQNLGLFVPDEIITVTKIPPKSPKSLNKKKSRAVTIDSSKSPEISQADANDVHVNLAANVERSESDKSTKVMKISPKTLNKLNSNETKMNSSNSPVTILKELVFNSASDREELGGSRSIEKIPDRPKLARRSSRRIVNMVSVENNARAVEDESNCSDHKPSQLSRKSIFNTPKAEWKLRLNESLENNIPKKSTSTRKSKKSLGVYKSYTRSEEFFTPNKNADDENLNNDVFFTPDSTKEDDKTVNYISPYVTISRGKSAARKEYQMNKSLDGLNSSVAGSTDPKSPKAAAAYFERMLNREVIRIQNLCEIWQRYKETDHLSEDACGLIDMTIGQSNLLLSKKFNQFRGLIEQCQSEDQSIMKIKCEDLHGFWDMIFKQVDDLDKRFDNLEDMKKNNWLEDVPKKKMPKKSVTKKKRGRTKSAPEPSSLLKKTILAARRKKIMQKNNSEGDVPILFPKKDSTPNRNILGNSSMSNGVPDCSTPGRGILKSSNSKSERRKTVAFQDSRTSLVDEQDNKSTPAFKRRDTPLPKRKSERISLGRSRLLFGCD